MQNTEYQHEIELKRFAITTAAVVFIAAMIAAAVLTPVKGLIEVAKSATTQQAGK